jgi:hypothetical protein
MWDSVMSRRLLVRIARDKLDKPLGQNIVHIQIAINVLGFLAGAPQPDRVRFWSPLSLKAAGFSTTWGAN